MRRLVIKDISGNHIGMGCYNISISGNNNTLGNDCGDIIADFGFSDNTFGSNVNYLTVHNGVQYVSIAGSVGLQGYTQYAQILNGTHGYYMNPLQISFQRGVSYTQFAGLTSSGVLKIWNPADLVPET